MEEALSVDGGQGMAGPEEQRVNETGTELVVVSSSDVYLLSTNASEINA